MKEKTVDVFPLEKSEIARLLDVPVYALAKELGPELCEQIGWRKGQRQRIYPKHFPAIFEHFYGTTDGWDIFFSKGKASIDK